MDVNVDVLNINNEEEEGGRGDEEEQEEGNNNNNDRVNEEEQQQQQILHGCDITSQEEQWAKDLMTMVKSMMEQQDDAEADAADANANVESDEEGTTIATTTAIGRGGGGGGSGNGNNTTTTTMHIPLLDFDYVVFGLFARGRNPQDTIRRMKGMEIFRNYYKIQDTSEECVWYIRQFIELQPGVLLYLDKLNPSHGNTGEGVLVWDQSKLVPSRATTLDDPIGTNFRISVVTAYYITTIMQPTIAACRRGTHTLLECNNLGWNNYDSEYDSKLWEQLFQYQPENMASMKFYNTNTITNIWFSFFRRMMPPQQQAAMQLGCQIEYSDDGNPNNPKLLLSDLYLQPNYQVAMERVLQKGKELADLRFYNQQMFRLPSSSR